MEVTVEKLLNSIECLSKLSGMKLPVKASYRIQKAITKIDRELEAYRAARQKIFDTYSEEINQDLEDEQSPKPPKKEIPESKIELANKDHDELIKEKVELDLLPIPIDYFGNSIEVIPTDLMRIDFLLE